MRYSLAGGYQPNGENGLGLNYCISAYDGYQALNSIDQEIRDGMEIWMNSVLEEGKSLTPDLGLHRLDGEQKRLGGSGT